MKLLDKLERKFGHLAIKNLMLYIVALNGVMYLMQLIDSRGQLAYMLTLIPSQVLKGEVWRLLSFILIPPSASPIFIIFALYFYYMVGSGLEQEWGSFKFNIYYLIGMLGTIAAAFITNGAVTALYLNLSLFLAFAFIYPDYELLLFFILPLKVKYLAWLNWAFVAYTVLLAPVPLSHKGAALVSVINYFLFFGKEIFTHRKTRQQVHYNRRKFNANLPRDITIHRCAVCGITEKEAPRMDFRYCMECEGDYEYCSEHLENHEHMKG